MLITDHERLTRGFFRKVNAPALFRRFFETFGVWDAMGLDAESTCVEIHEAWERLDVPNRQEIDEALRRMNDIAREKGRFTLERCAEDCGVEDYIDLTLPRLAMRLFLDHRRVFEETYDFFMLEKTESLRTLLGRQPVPCEPTAERIERFKVELSRALRRESHGPQLLVEVAPPHPEKWMAVIPHETYVRPDHEFDEQSEITTRERRPVYEMVLIYFPETGVLKLRAGRGRKKIERAAAVFATEILGQDAFFFEEGQVVNFAPLLDPGFSFAREPSDSFEWARPTKIGFCHRAHPGVTYEIHRKDQYVGAPDVLGILNANGIALSEIEIRSLSIRFKFQKSARDTRTVDLAVPNRSSLDETDRDRYIESVLVRWGLIDHAANDHLARVGLAG